MAICAAGEEDERFMAAVYDHRVGRIMRLTLSPTTISYRDPGAFLSQAVLPRCDARQKRMNERQSLGPWPFLSCAREL